MASFASEVSIPQSNEFFTRFGRFGGTKAVLRLLLSDDHRMRLWVESLFIAPAEHFTVFVSYQLPAFAELNGTLFDEAYKHYNGSYVWQEHESVHGLIDRTPSEKRFLVKCFNRFRTSEQVITWAEANGYRTATHEEAVDFAKIQPNLQHLFLIVALGSFTLDRKDRRVATLVAYEQKRCLGTYSFEREWGSEDCFLLVRK